MSLLATLLHGEIKLVRRDVTLWNGGVVVGGSAGTWDSVTPDTLQSVVESIEIDGMTTLDKNW